MKWGIMATGTIAAKFADTVIGTFDQAVSDLAIQGIHAAAEPLDQLVDELCIFEQGLFDGLLVKKIAVAVFDSDKRIVVDAVLKEEHFTNDALITDHLDIFFGTISSSDESSGFTLFQVVQVIDRFAYGQDMLPFFEMFMAA